MAIIDEITRISAVINGKLSVANSANFAQDEREMALDEARADLKTLKNLYKSRDYLAILEKSGNPMVNAITAQCICEPSVKKDKNVYTLAVSNEKVLNIVDFYNWAHSREEFRDRFTCESDWVGKMYEMANIAVCRFNAELSTHENKTNAVKAVLAHYGRKSVKIDAATLLDNEGNLKISNRAFSEMMTGLYRKIIPSFTVGDVEKKLVYMEKSGEISLIMAMGNMDKSGKRSFKNEDVFMYALTNLIRENLLGITAAATFKAKKEPKQIIDTRNTEEPTTTEEN